MHLVAASKKGMLAHQMHRMLDQLQIAIAPGAPHSRSHADVKPTPMGGEGKVIQADETYYGNSSKPRRATAKVADTKLTFSHSSSRKARSRRTS